MCLWMLVATTVAVTTLVSSTSAEGTSRAKVTEFELEAQESGYAPLYGPPPAYAAGGYGKHAQDYGTYGHGQYGKYDNYGDKGYGGHALAQVGFRERETRVIPVKVTTSGL